VIPPEESSDEELANLMADSEIIDNDSTDKAGSVEVGIPPPLDDNDSQVDSTEESFSINDFEENLESKGSQPSDALDVEDSVENTGIAPNHSETTEQGNIVSNNAPIPSTKQNGDVAQFRQTLASLSRQLELDRLAFLHKSLQDSGEELPSLADIASDITGNRPMKPSGDLDQYGKRPAARLEGWLSGLSFGVSKRAKKFSK